jgi:type IV secretion system protein VirD4
MIDYENDPYGSAGSADARARRRAGLNKGQGAYIGTDAAGRHCHSDQMSAMLICGGARSLKGSLVIPHLVDGALRTADQHHHILNFDPKGQDSMVAALQVRQGRYCISINPRRKAAPYHRMNPTSHLVRDSAVLIPDAMTTSASWIPETDPKAAYFQRNAQKIVTAAMVTMARVDGVVTLPNLADKMSGIGETTDEWLGFEYDISCQPEPQVNEIATMLSALREGTHEGGGWEGIKGEIGKSFMCLMDPQLRDAFSPPFDFCFSQLNESDAPPHMVSILEDLEFVETSAPIIRAIFTSALIFKRRALRSRPQFWLLQEIGNIGAWPLAQDLATISAGYGIRTCYVVQSTRQLENLKRGASDIIPNSCGTQVFLGTRSASQAALIQKQLGRMTLSQPDKAAIERARNAKAKGIYDILRGKADPAQTLLDIKHQEQMASLPKKIGRDVRGIDEILNEPNGNVFVFMPGVLKRPAYLKVIPYWQRKDLRGAYLGDPFHNDPGTVEIATWRGQRTRKIITEDAPRNYRDWPQYRETGQWSYVQGFRP